MKKIILFALAACFGMQMQAQTQKQKVNVSEVEAVATTNFAFTNTGTAPLIIHQAFASCGCTVPTYTKEPIKPGERGSIDVTYNGKDKFPGHFQKNITVRTNAVNEVVRLTIEGMME